MSILDALKGLWGTSEESKAQPPVPTSPVIDESIAESRTALDQSLLRSYSLSVESISETPPPPPAPAPEVVRLTDAEAVKKGFAILKDPTNPEHPKVQVLRERIDAYGELIDPATAVFNQISSFINRFGAELAEKYPEYYNHGFKKNLETIQASLVCCRKLMQCFESGSVTDEDIKDMGSFCLSFNSGNFDAETQTVLRGPLVGEASVNKFTTVFYKFILIPLIYLYQVVFEAMPQEVPEIFEEHKAFQPVNIREQFLALMSKLDSPKFGNGGIEYIHVPLYENINIPRPDGSHITSEHVLAEYVGKIAFSYRTSSFVDGCDSIPTNDEHSPLRVSPPIFRQRQPQSCVVYPSIIFKQTW